MCKDIICACRVLYVPFPLIEYATSFLSIILIIALIFHKLLKKNLGCWWGEQPSVCDYLDVKEMSVSIILGALTHKKGLQIP